MKNKVLKWLAGFSLVFFLFASCENSISNKAAASGDTLSAGRAIVNGIDSNEDPSGVMLQGFNWSSADRNDSSTYYKWYNVVISRANDIKNTFEYVWFPPPSTSPDFAPEGYIPTELNDLNSRYGTKTQLKQAINAIKPAKAIADIVINHRGGSTSWGDFRNPQWTGDYYSICYGDEGFTNPSSPMYNSTARGAADTGENYADARDIDHTSTTVQNGIITWMSDVLKSDAGFVGWRYDFVKGFGGQYVGKYNAQTSAVFSVGEFWPTNTFNQNDTANWKNQLMNWVNSTTQNSGQKSRVFDFVLKGNMNYAFGWGSQSTLWNLSRLADSNNIFRTAPASAVTFIDNHDTGSTQKHWEIDPGDLAPAYAFILTHPGYPCVAWQHYFSASECGVTSNSANVAQYRGGDTVPGTSKTFKQHINYLIDLRKDQGIRYDSAITVLAATTTNYAARITGTDGEIVVKIGGDNWSPTGTGYTGNSPIYSGTNFAVWVKDGGGTATTVTLKMAKDVGYGNGLYFTGSYNEGSNWTVATRGTYDNAGYWYVTVTPPSNGNFEWKVLKGAYSLGETVTGNFSGLTWESGSNHNQSNLFPSFNGGF
ncbi:hypothetical protein K7I13_00995 [Brucepastera parasyntrophica]|uniref:alpha-amylase C-terminal beta-sheet domain-containing protein n=1 Tax=Brucepastera parasyntrophica TaxID=2880008 RepID=UPI00210BBDFD|nr:alpha-amylase C-terminal beta-sheet domain-containing protein [Brucepastera parasyntrophica]ULQ59954.1 hypothetical protein K7I13_00995 [Brucepastera parasyntrophica]